MTYDLLWFKEEVRDALGEPFDEIIEDADIEKWVNRGRERIGPRYIKSVSITWTSGDLTKTIAADFVFAEEIIVDEGVCLEGYRILGTSIVWLDPNGVQDDGGATIYYRTYYPEITDIQPSLMQPSEDDAVVAYVQYRFFRSVGNGRSDYRRYSVLLGQNGVTLDDLRELSNEYLADFRDAVAAVPLDLGVTYYPGV